MHTPCISLERFCALECAMASNKQRIRVLVADDSPMALRSVCKYLELQEGLDVVGTARDGSMLCTRPNVSGLTWY